MQFPPPFSWLALLWAIYLDPQCKIFLCTVSSYYSRINRDRFHVKRQQERESFIAKAVQRFFPSAQAWGQQSLAADPGLFRAPTAVMPSHTVPEGGEDAGSCATSWTSCLGSHTGVFQGQPEGYLDSQHCQQTANSWASDSKDQDLCPQGWKTADLKHPHGLWCSQLVVMQSQLNKSQLLNYRAESPPIPHPHVTETMTPLFQEPGTAE